MVDVFGDNTVYVVLVVKEVCGQQQKMRTLTIGDRTISYDAGLDYAAPSHVAGGNRTTGKRTVGLSIGFSVRWLVGNNFLKKSGTLHVHAPSGAFHMQ